MKYFYLFILFIFLTVSSYGQNCSDVVVTIEEAAVVGEKFLMRFVNYSNKGTKYIIYLDGEWYDEFFDSDGTLDWQLSINVPGKHQFEVQPWVNGLGRCHSKYLDFSVLETSTENYTLRTNSPLRNSNGNIFFVNSSNELCMSTEFNGSWYDAPLNYNAPDVLTGTKFTAETEYGVFYIGTDHKIYNMQRSSLGDWLHHTPVSNVYARGNSDLEIHGRSVFYFDNNRKINAIMDLGRKPYSIELAPNAPAAKDGTGFTTERWFDGGSHIFYVSSNDKLIELSWTSGTGWNYSTRASNIGIRSDSDLKYLKSNTSLVWIGTNNKIMGTFKSSSGGDYYSFILNDSAPEVKSGCDFFVNTDTYDDDIYFVGTDNRVYKLYYSSGWKFTEAAEQQIDAKGGLTLSDSKLFFSRSSDNKIYYYESGNLKSAKITNSQIIKENQIDVYPNPTRGRSYIRLPKSSDIKSANVKVYDVVGNLVYEDENFSSGYIDFTSYSDGTYFMKIKVEGAIVTKKIILKKDY